MPDLVPRGDFAVPELGKINPYGVDDVARGEGWVNVGTGCAASGQPRVKSGWIPQVRWCGGHPCRWEPSGQLSAPDASRMRRTEFSRSLPSASFDNRPAHVLDA